MIGAEHEGLVEPLGLELEPLEALGFKFGLVARKPLVLLVAMSVRKSRTRVLLLLLPRSFRKYRTLSRQSPRRRTQKQEVV
eukprot:5289104-Pleurochrysis_carterae.AAC.1